jgi:hypothetical protein
VKVTLFCNVEVGRASEDPARKRKAKSDAITVIVIRLGLTDEY